MQGWRWFQALVDSQGSSCFESLKHLGKGRVVTSFPISKSTLTSQPLQASENFLAWETASDVFHDELYLCSQHYPWNCLGLDQLIKDPQHAVALNALGFCKRS